MLRITSRLVLAALIALLLPLIATAKQELKIDPQQSLNLLQNPDFEDAVYPSGRIPGWHLIQAPYPYRVHGAVVD
ncbi:MAG: hypothetical protein P8J91_17685 [Pirellulaceae bacterium]|nr:hypothetical protein [Pirellulaceae bacterium]MDG2105587.1 hypothetical protein [Pirellulaceae bacterium]